MLARHKVPTPAQGSITDALAELVSELECGPDVAAVVAVPGVVDYESGRALWAPHLPSSWVAELTEDNLASRLCRRVSIANDADLAAVGEAYFGAGRQATTLSSSTARRNRRRSTVEPPIGTWASIGGRDRPYDHRSSRLFDSGESATLEEFASGK